MAKLIRPDGTVEDVVPKNGKKFKLEESQALVGGYIEFVQPLGRALLRFHGLPPNAIMYVDEEGLLKGLPLNPRASLLACRRIVGNALVGASKEL